MKIDLMRKIDYWVGVPLCFLFTIVNCLLKIFNFKKKKKMIPRKILFIKISEMGSIVLSYPFMDLVRKECRSAELFFLTFKSNKYIFELLKIIPPAIHNL